MSRTHQGEVQWGAACDATAQPAQTWSGPSSTAAEQTATTAGGTPAHAAASRRPHKVTYHHVSKHLRGEQERALRPGHARPDFKRRDENAQPRVVVSELRRRASARRSGAHGLSQCGVRGCARGGAGGRRTRYHVRRRRYRTVRARTNLVLSHWDGNIRQGQGRGRLTGVHTAGGGAVRGGAGGEGPPSTAQSHPPPRSQTPSLVAGPSQTPPARARACWPRVAW